MSKKGPPNGSPDERSDDDSPAAVRQPELKKSAITAKKVKVKGKGKGKGKVQQNQTNSNAKGNAKVKAKDKSKDNANRNRDEDCRSQAIGPPFTLQHRWNPLHNAQAILLGTVDGDPKKFVTNVSVYMSKAFHKIMASMLEEAIGGAVKT